MTADDTLNYIGDMARELESMAAQAGFPKVAYILRMAHNECDANRASPPPPTDEDTSGLLN